MIIERMEILPVLIPYRMVRHSTWSSRSGARTLVVRLTDSDGRIGYGDCIFKQSMAAGRLLLEMARPLVEGASIHDIEAVRNRLSMVQWWGIKHEDSFVGGPLLAAIENAMWDLIGKAAGQPVHRLLGGVVTPRLPLAYQVPSGPPELLESEVAFALEKGFQFLSVKLAKANRCIDEDVATIARIRELAPRVTLSADINGAWTVPTAVRALRRLERYDLAYVETPVVGLDNMATLRQRVGVPLAVDEESCSLKKLMEVVRLQAADVVVLDLPSLGGIRGLQKAADLLECANIPAVVHGNGEMLASFAGFQLAAAHRQFRHFGHQFYFEHGETYVRDHDVLTATRPEFIITDSPGMGHMIDEQRLGQMSAQSAVEDNDITVANPGAVPMFPKY